MSRSSGQEFCRKHKHPRLKRPVSRDQIRREFESLYRKAGFKGRFVLNWPQELTETHEQNARRYAQVRVGLEPPIFELAEQARWLPKKNRKALFAHEIGHVVDPEADEPGADRAGAAATGVKIGYDLRWPSTKRAKGLQVALNPDERLREILRRAREENTTEAWERYTREATRRDLIHPADAYLLGLMASPAVLVDRGARATPRQRAEFILLEDLDPVGFRLIFDGTVDEQGYVDAISGPPVYSFVALFCGDISREHQAGHEIPLERLERRLHAARRGLLRPFSDWIAEQSPDEWVRSDARSILEAPEQFLPGYMHLVAPYLAGVQSEELRAYFESFAGMARILSELYLFFWDHAFAFFLPVEQSDVKAALDSFRAEWGGAPFSDEIWLLHLEEHLIEEGYRDLLVDRSYGVVGTLTAYRMGPGHDTEYAVQLEPDSEALDSMVMSLLFGDDGLLTRYLRGEG